MKRLALIVVLIGLLIAGLVSSPIQQQHAAAIKRRSPAGYTVQLLMPFEAGNHGDTIDATYTNANDIGTPPGPWSIVGTAPTVSTAQAKQLITPVIVGATTYDTVGGTRSMAFTQASAGNVLCQFSDDPALNDVTLACWFMDTTPSGDVGTFDYISLGNRHPPGGFAIMQCRNGQAKAHSGTGLGSGISYSRNTWYWCVLTNVEDDGCYLTLYDASGTLVGSSVSLHAGAGQGVRVVEFGNVTPHGQFPSGSVYFDNVVILYGNGAVAYPVGP